MVSQFSSKFLFITIFGLFIIIETLLCPTAEASEKVTIKAYCTGDASYRFPVYATVEIRLKDCETLGYVKKEVKCIKERISYAFIFERKQNHSAVVNTQMTTDGRNIQCVDYEDEEDLIMEDHLSTYYKADDEWVMHRDENGLVETDMTSQSMRDQIFNHPLFINATNARDALYSYIGYKERQKTLKIKAYCTGHRSNPVPVYEDVQRRLDACKQLGNVCWDEKDKELEKHLLFYHKNGKDEQLAILLRSYHNLKKVLEGREKDFAQVNSLNDLGAMSRTYDNMDNELTGQKQYEQEGKQHQMFGFLHPISEENLKRQKVMYDAAKNELEAYMKKMKQRLDQELAIKKSLENEKLDTEMEMEEKLKNDSEKHAEKGGEEIILHNEPTTVEKKLDQRKGKNVIVSSPSQQ
ncbi:hypothetical protein niasHT_031754 [Heterodera trifolii]|uniref:Effector protein n=1 Tax=Heterodera trifolii TaxID=157864 RepID=A0ABD2IQ73_9BILA